MTDIAWLAPVPHKDIGGSKHRIVPDENLQIASSRPGSAISLITLDSQQSKALVSHTKWKVKPPMSAVRGAWQHPSDLRPGSSRANLIRPKSASNKYEQFVSSSGSRPASAYGDRDAATAVYKAIKNHSGLYDNDRSSRSRPSSSRSARLLHHVSDANSVNKNLENEINSLQGTILKDGSHVSGSTTGNAEFLHMSQKTTLYTRPKSGKERGKKTFDGSILSDLDNDETMSKDHVSLLKSDKKSSSNGHQLGDNVDTNKPNFIDSHEQDYAMEDLEKSKAGKNKDLHRSQTSHDANNDLPKIVIGDEVAVDPDTEIVSDPDVSIEPDTKKVKTKEEMAEDRKRKLRMKLRHANAFRTLFNETRGESLRSTLDMESCFNVEDLKQAKIVEKKEEERLKTIATLKPSLPAGTPLKTLKELRASKSKTQSHSHLPEASQLMMSPESLAVMRSTLDEKYHKKFGEQPWLLGRLALSKQTCRFELPMDMLVLKTITPMNYLINHCIMSRRRKTLYKSTFQRADKDRDGWLSYKDLVKALKEIHVNYIDENEIEALSQMLNLDMSPEYKYNAKMFSAIAAFSERLVLYLRHKNRKSSKGWKEKLEDADFCNLKWKLEGVDVNPAVRKVLEVL